MINFNDIHTAQARYQEWVTVAEQENQAAKNAEGGKTAVSRLSKHLTQLGNRLQGHRLSPAAPSYR
ncbi:MAG: hypothetical protein H6668_25540 [Ardenticatenaceae bacterium]|nr:hypothetical protein [Ardenticatenaceae bacterium]